MTLKALSNKLSSLEDELETMKQDKTKNTGKSNEIETTKTNEMKNVNQNINATKPKVEPKENDVNECDLTLDLESINKTLQAAQDKKSSKPLHIKLPSMPNICQPPQLSETSAESESKKIETKPVIVGKPQNNEKKMNAAINSLDTGSLLLLLDKLKVYFKEIEAEKKQNEEFRSTLLESVNAQNTQILHLLSQLAAQQKQMDTLKNEVTSLTAKVEKYENNANNDNSDKPQWRNMKKQIMPSSMIMTTQNVNKIYDNNENEIALKDIKNVIEASRPNKTYKTQQILTNTDWKCISNELSEKNVDSVEYGGIPQQPYTIQKHATKKKRSFLPSTTTQEEQIQRVLPPQPVPKHTKNKKSKIQSFVSVPESMEMNNSNYIMTNYPKVRIERYHK